MTAPTPRSAVPTLSGSASNVSTATATLAAHQTGDYLLVFLAARTPTSVTPPTGWAAIKSGLTGGVYLGLFQQTTLAASSSETSPQFTFGTATTYKTHAYSIPMRNSGAINRAGVNATSGNNTAADPPSNTSFGGTQDYLWFASMVLSGNSAITAGPSGYSNFNANAGSTSADCGIATAWKTALASVTEDPGAFTNGSNQWIADTLAVWDPVTAAATSHAGNAMLLGIG